MSLTNEDLQAIKELLSPLHNEISNINNEISDMKNDISNIKNKVSTIENEVTTIKLTLENETNRNIKIVAEGHLDLSRKLNEAIKIASDIEAKQEIQDIYLNMHESKLRAL